MGRKTPDNLIAMCTHGRSGVRRWMLGSVTETVVRHSGDPVLVLRAADAECDGSCRYVYENPCTARRVEVRGTGSALRSLPCAGDLRSRWSSWESLTWQRLASHFHRQKRTYFDTADRGQSSPVENILKELPRHSRWDRASALASRRAEPAEVIIAKAMRRRKRLSLWPPMAVRELTAGS